MSEYDVRPGGSLKLKGGVIDGGIVKKKKKKSKSKAGEESSSGKTGDTMVIEAVKESLEREDKEKSQSPAPNSGRGSPAIPSASSSSRKTEAERRFEEVQKRRLAERVAKLAHKTHKERVAELNRHLESLSEHHDIPKVGPG